MHFRVWVTAALSLSASTALARPSLDGDHLSRLGRYDVLVFSDPAGDGLERGKAIGVFDATPEEVFRVATDYNKWKDYLPKVSGSQVVGVDGRSATVDMTADLPWPAGATRVEAKYTQEKLAGDIYRIRFDLQHGSMKKYLGAIYIEPWSNDHNKAAVTYELVAEPDILAPRSAINKLIKRSAAGFVHALRQRINDLHQMGFLHPLPKSVTPQPQPAIPLDASSVKAKLQR
jgi:ribosome-associated toxin RatA of RatAB toxin-antitoxin module